jgi:hypothetical protein
VPDQSVHLAPKRGKREKVNQSERSQEPDPRVIVGRPANGFFPSSPEDLGHSGSKRTVVRDKSISRTSEPCPARNPTIAPQTEATSSSGFIAEHPKDRFRALVDGTVGLDQVNGGAKTFNRDILRKPRSRRLKRSHLNFLPRSFLPTPNPLKAKGTVSVVNEERLFPRWFAMN